MKLTLRELIDRDGADQVAGKLRYHPHYVRQLRSGSRRVTLSCVRRVWLEYGDEFDWFHHVAKAFSAPSSAA